MYNSLINHQKYIVIVLFRNFPATKTLTSIFMHGLSLSLSLLVSMEAMASSAPTMSRLSPPFHHSTLLSSSSSPSSSYAPIRRRALRTGSPHKLNLKRLTSRIVQLTRRRQLHQVLYSFTQNLRDI